MDTISMLPEDHQLRSDFIRGLVQRSFNGAKPSLSLDKVIPKRIVQFWDDLNRLPDDVKDCMESWKKVDQLGFERILFGKIAAKNFISKNLGARFERAFERCYHPAMQSDYFRLCYIMLEGGCYIDADDVYSGSPIDHLFDNGLLKIQPLCYDITTDSMVPPKKFTKEGANATSWIFYFNNNPLISSAGHPIIEYALEQATASLESDSLDSLPEIQSTTGPGNLTKSIFDLTTQDFDVREEILVLVDWEDTAESRWDLSYRNDSRNWRLSNSQYYNKY